MALEEKSIIDLVEVIENNTIQVRRRDQILKDGVEISASFHRHIVCPGDDLTDQDPKVVAIAEALWTPEVIEAYQATLQVNE